MKVDNPRYDDDAGEVVDCSQCPLDDANSCMPSMLCTQWHLSHNCDCPTSVNYQEACTLADTATKRAVKEYRR